MNAKNRVGLLQILLCAVLTVSYLGCGSSSAAPPPPPPAISVTVSPTTATMMASGTQAFTPTVTNDSANKGVNWTVSCSAPSCGSVSPTSTLSGAATTYTAPSTPPASNLTVTVTATSVTDSTKSMSATVTVNAISVSVSPTTANVAINTTQQFTATVTNDPSNTGVTWALTQNGTSCSPACGTVAPASTASGSPTTYTAPATLPSPATVTVTATSVTDTTKSASAAVTITIPISVSVAPTSVYAVINKASQFVATTQNDTANKGVTWALTQNGTACSPACGAVSPASTASGAYTTYTAPATVPANPTVTITATSVTDTTKSASSTITINTAAVNAQPFINEPLVPDAVAPGGSAFTLTVNGTGFVSGSVVNWNGSARATTFVNGSQLTANILASDIATANTGVVTVVSPTPGGGTSNAVFFSVTASSSSVVFAGSTLPAATGPVGLATADFNGDGKLDLVVTEPGSGSVSVMLGNGDGTFQPAVNYPVTNTTTNQTFQVAVGDFNGDGKLDFVVSDTADDYVSVFLGNGDGTFQAGVNYAVGTSPTAVAVADVNGDGKLDLVVTSQNCAPNPTCLPAPVSVLLGNGDGTFQPHSDFDAGLDPNWVVVGDFNGDGVLDLAVIDGQGNSNGSAALILLGNGDGTFQSPVSYPLNTNAASAIAADFNGDGKLDLAVADNVGVLSILLGNGDGTFQPRVDYPAGTFPWGSLVVGDFNGDGKLDVAVSDSGSAAVSLFLGNGDGTFQPFISIGVGNSPHGVAAGDFNQDGRLDLAVSNSADNTVSILMQISTLTITPASLTFAAQPVATASPAQAVQVTNNGPLAVSISGISVTGTNAADFSQTNNCGSSLAVSASCTINVTYTPSVTGPETATIAIADSGAGSPQSVNLSGTGIVAGPNATLAPTSLTFGTQLLATTSAAQTVTLTNYGTAALTISSIATSGDFELINNCASSLAALANCTISVIFTPTQIGTLTGLLSFTDNASGSPQTVPLTGAGTEVEFNPASLSFGNVVVGGTRSLTTTLTNTGATTLDISGISTTDPFSQTDNCGATVSAGQSCTITVTFAPTYYGLDQSANVSVADNGGASPQLVPVSGNGCKSINEGRCKSTDGLARPAVRSAISRNRSVSVPQPSGPKVVGTRVMRLVDSSRVNPFTNDGRARELLVRFWYPAASANGCQRAAYTSPRVWSYYSQLTGLPLPEVTTNSCQDAPVASGAHPVVVFEPGYTATFTDYTFLMEDLASRGYVVASVDHTYEATIVEFPDGRLIGSAVGSHFGNTWRLDDETFSVVIATRLADLSFLVNELDRMNAASGNPFSGRLDPARIAIMGHSLGGGVALAALQQDSRFKAAVLLDGSIADGSLIPTNASTLILAMGRGIWEENECGLWNNLVGPHLAVNLRGDEHLTPSDEVWLAKGAIQTGTMGPDRTIAAIRDYVAAFLDANLRSKAVDPLLTGPSSNYPDAVVITQDQALCGQP